MSDQQDRVVVDAEDRLEEILQTFGAPTGPGEMSRAMRLARAARTAALSLADVAHGPGSLDAQRTGDARCALTAVTVSALPAGGYLVELHLIAHAGMASDLTRVITQQVHHAADERGLGPYLEKVSIVIEGLTS